MTVPLPRGQGLVAWWRRVSRRNFATWLISSVLLAAVLVCVMVAIIAGEQLLVNHVR